MLVRDLKLGKEIRIRPDFPRNWMGYNETFLERVKGRNATIKGYPRSKNSIYVYIEGYGYEYINRDMIDFSFDHVSIKKTITSSGFFHEGSV